MGRPSYDPRIVDGEVIMFLVDRGEYMRTADYDTLYSTAIFNRKRYEEAESRIHELEAALHEIRDADCRGEVCKGIACVALNVAYPTQDRGGEHG
jgi:hypothetical protein